MRTLPRIALALAALAVAGLFNAAHATFPGENGVIVFDVLNPDTEDRDIQRVSPDNSKVTTLASFARSPSVSPNGRKVAFLSGNAQSLTVMDIDGSNVVLLDSGQHVDSPAWLPDGSKVVFVRKPPNKPIELWTVNPDGTGKAFKRSLEGIYNPNHVGLAWSPSANVYTFYDGEDLDIANDLTPVISKLVPDAGASSWAPDGGSILFLKKDGGQFEINPDGSNLRQVPAPGPIRSVSAISPDGAFIAGDMWKDGQSQLATRKRAGSPITFSWAADTLKADWSRVPMNCSTSTPEGGGDVLAGDVNFYASQCAIAVMPVAVNRIVQQAIAIGPDQRVYHRALISDPFAAPTWTRFAPVPGYGGNINGIHARKIAIAAAKDGSAQVLIIGATDNLVYHSMRYADGTWSGFAAIDGWAGANSFAARDVAITINASSPTSPGNAQVIANGLDGGNVFYRVRRAEGSWTPFIGVPGLYANQQVSHALAISASEYGETDVLATLEAPDGSIRLMHQLRKHDSSWSSYWVAVSVPSSTVLSKSSDVAVTRTPDYTAQLLFTDSAGNVLFQTRATPSQQSTWGAPTTTSKIIDTVGRSVSISAGVNAQSSSQILLTRTYPQ